MKVLVAGGKGFIGSHLVKRLKAEGWNVVSPAPHETEPASALREEPPKP